MTDIEKTLEEARGRAKGYGEKLGNKETADDYLKAVYAMLYEDAPATCKTVPEKDAWVRNQELYWLAIERKRAAYSEWTAAQTYMKLLLAEVEVWRTKQANNRFLDKAHQ